MPASQPASSRDVFRPRLFRPFGDLLRPRAGSGCRPISTTYDSPHPTVGPRQADAHRNWTSPGEHWIVNRDYGTNLTNPSCDSTVAQSSAGEANPQPEDPSLGSRLAVRDPSTAATTASSSSAAMNLAIGNNFNLNEKPCFSIEPTKKRKLEHEHVTFPLSKLKFKDRSCGTEDESSSANHTRQYHGDCRMEVSEECISDTTLDTPWSSKDSNTINCGCDSAVTVDTDKMTMASVESWYPDQHSISSSSSNNYAFKDTYYNVDGNKLTSVIQGEETAKSEVEDEIRSKHQLCSGDKDDFLEFEQISKLEEESLLFPNALLANSFLPSSETDGAGHAADVNHGPRKPTIDQEFEQYFSMLML